MASADLLPLAFLYTDNQRAIEGVTRFQKLVFLAQQETSLEGGYEYEPDQYGPFSSELYSALEELERKGLIKQATETTRSGNEKYVYSLTKKGQLVVQKILNDEKYEDASEVFDYAQEIKRKHNEEPLDRLLRYVYNEYSSYTENSTIKGELGV